ncbi:uncharacterized protein BDV17DRAFT_293678 [Aspergillus undulatus]|uniref:uncharacterized protein n=1 Tax=Aspergillus undulatus TaxID=1810928 RepID=UPI003CCD9760
MKRSKSLGFPLWSKLHAPLPRTPRQSQQLLETLTSSFRRELDREHPPNASSPDGSDAADKNLFGGLLSENHPRSSSHAADKHLGMILDHPLFRSKPSRDPDLRDRAVHATAKAKSVKHPMLVFDELMASGSATAAAVSKCIIDQVLLASPHKGDGFVREMRKSGAGSRFMTWWWSSDDRTKISFINGSLTFHKQYCKFMVAVGLQDIVLTWLKTLKTFIDGEYNKGPKYPPTEPFKYLLGSLLQAEIDYGGGMSSAMRHYLDAFNLFRSTGDEDSRVTLLNSLIKPAAYILSTLILRSGRNIEERIPHKLYEDYAAAFLSMIKKKDTHAVPALLALYHPTVPDAKPFVHFVRHLPPSRIESMSWNYRERNLRAGLDALRLLDQVGDKRDSLYVARFLQQILELKPEERDPLWHEHDHVTSEERALIASWDLTPA